MSGSELLVIAIGGNAIAGASDHSVEGQFQAMLEVTVGIARLIEVGHRVVLTHGNGPQVGYILRRSELASHELHQVPLPSCVADTQGAMGYQIQQALHEVSRHWSDPIVAAAVVTRVRVDPDDPGLVDPTKPIGGYLDLRTATRRRDEEGWTVRRDGPEGFRRLVASPRPREIIELDAIRHLVAGGHVVIAAGGGGVPVVVQPDGSQKGVDAVVDKDFASSLLARELDADRLVITTTVDRVCLGFGTDAEAPIDQMTVSEARRHVDEGHFGPGSMLPKVQASIEFVEATGRRAVITDLVRLEEAVAGGAGTTIVAG